MFPGYLLLAANRISWPKPDQQCMYPHAYQRPSAESIAPEAFSRPAPMMQVRNEKARRFLMNMRKKPRVNFEKYFVKADRGALRLLQRMLAFDPVERPTCEEALADPYFNGLSQPGREPSAQPVSKLSFEFERRKLTTDEVRIVGKAPACCMLCLLIPWPPCIPCTL